MCNEQRYTESGAPLGPARCKEYHALAGKLAIAENLMAKQQKEIVRLKDILAPLLAHAASHDYAPPIRFSVADCREIKDKVDAK